VVRTPMPHRWTFHRPTLREFWSFRTVWFLIAWAMYLLFHS
jgi:hypothetical protein